MITPTRTVCYAIPVNSKERFVVNSARVNGALIELQQRPMKLHYLCYSEVDRIIVKEEPIEQYHPGMVHDGDFSDLEIEPGKIVRYPMCNKNFNPANPCDCGNCCSFLGSFSYLRPIPMPRDWYQKMYQREWVNEE